MGFLKKTKENLNKLRGVEEERHRSKSRMKLLIFVKAAKI